MPPFDRFPRALARGIRFVLTDVDDTLTAGARLPAATYEAIERLSSSGVTVVPVTAAPAGWCDLMARMWPIGGVIGENGGLCFRCDPVTGATARDYWASPAERDAAQARLAALASEIAAALPQAELAHDRRYRETTVAFLNRHDNVSEQILVRLRAAGAQATLNSLWVLGWFGGFDKLAMARRMMGELFATDLARDAEHCLYIGDSPNDAPMFASLPHSVGVSTVRDYASHMTALPPWITRGAGGAGFVEVAEALLAARGPD